MRKTICLSLTLSGCSMFSSPPSPQTPNIAMGNNFPAVSVMYDARVVQMTRNEVIQATKECETTGLRAVPIITKRLISGQMSEMIVDIVCMPRW